MTAHLDDDSDLLDDSNPLSAARGVVFSVGLAGILWAAILWVLLSAMAGTATHLHPAYGEAIDQQWRNHLNSKSE